MAGTTTVLDESVVIDVRTPREFSEGHVPGSVNVPLDLLHAHASSVAEVLGDDAVIVCRTGARAEDARAVLLAAGVRTTVLDGGLTRWALEGGDVATGDDGGWAMERQVRFVAGSLVALSTLAGRRWPKARLVAAGVGLGLVNSGVTDTCGLAVLLGRLPHNRRDDDPSITSVTDELAGRRG